MPQGLKKKRKKERKRTIVLGLLRFYVYLGFNATALSEIRDSHTVTRWRQTFQVFGQNTTEIFLLVFYTSTTANLKIQ